jgi:hypothetical protein
MVRVFLSNIIPGFLNGFIEWTKAVLEIKEERD